jgi:NAD(P)-dependent dehydrogenase (short-subunit alcohol dehydrogenase family)
MSRIAPYASVHEHPHGPGDARPTAYDVVTPTNDTILITGVSAGGLGIETAKALRQAGANVFITARDATKGQQVAGEIDAKLIVMDLGSLASIRAGVADFLRQSTKLNILINNAGLMFAPEGRTEDGFEVHFGTNHLGKVFSRSSHFSQSLQPICPRPSELPDAIYLRLQML